MNTKYQFIHADGFVTNLMHENVALQYLKNHANSNFEAIKIIETIPAEEAEKYLKEKFDIELTK